VFIESKKPKKRPKRKFSIPHDVALLVFFGFLIFLLILMMNWSRKVKERMHENNQAIELKIDRQYITEGLEL